MIRMAVVSVTLLIATAGKVPAGVLSPEAFGSFRDQNATRGTIEAGDGFFANSLVAQLFGRDGIEDRGLVEFDISGLAGPVGNASLDLVLNLNNGDTGVPLQYDVYSYAGNGIVNDNETADFSAGVLSESFTITNQAVGTTISIDVTSDVNALVASGESFAGFNIRYSGTQPPPTRFTQLSGFNDGTNMPTLSTSTAIVPEPTSAASFGVVACIAFCGRRRRSRRRCW